MKKKQKKELDVLYSISNFVGSVMELDDILRNITEETAEAMQVSVCSIYLFNPDHPEELILRATYGLNPEVTGKVRLKIGEGIPGWVVENNKTLSLEDGPADPRFRPIPGSDEEAYRAYLCAPLRIQEEIIGCMTIRKNVVYRFTEAEITFFETICKQVAIVIEKSRLHFQKIHAEKMAMVGISLSEIAHYIKNVLQSMKGGSWFVERGIESSNMEKTERGWKMLKGSIGKISSLVENMLNYSRHSNVYLERGNINAMLVEILNNVIDSARERGIEIRPELSDKLPDVYFDWNRMQDSFLNLLTNAMDAIPEDQDGLIIIKTDYDKKKSSVIIEVIDNGSGIPEDVQPKIFSIFFSTKGRKGTGIGLSVTRKIIEEHNGGVDFISTPGEGTTFKVEIPVQNS